MAYLAKHPIGKKSAPNTTAVAQHISQLPKRHALVRSGTHVGAIYTLDTPQRLTGEARDQRIQSVQEQTRTKYCLPRQQVEQAAKSEPAPADVQTTQLMPAADIARAVHEAIQTRVVSPASRWAEVEEA